MKSVWMAMLIAVVAGCIPTNYVKATANTPVCTSQQVAEWNNAKNDSLGVAGRDLTGHKIGFNAAYRTGVGMNWYPLDAYKQTVCGTLHHFNFYDGWSDEADWNNFVIPSPAYSSYLLDALSLADPEDVHDCGAPDNCMEAEITPDESFYENPFFTKSSDTSALEGRNICTYGPWVAEEAHGFRPEIHPSEMYWWRTNPDGTGDYMLMAVQDDSNRFDRAGDFEGASTRPTWWRAWSAFPRNDQFRIAFEADPAATAAKTLSVGEEYAREVDIVTGMSDSDDGKDHALVYNGKVLLTVQELQASDNGIGVTFLDLCRNDADTRLQGYVGVASRFGTGDRGNEGYHVLRVTEGTSRPPIVKPPLRILVRAEAVSGSVRRATIDGKPMLIGDVDLLPVGEKTTTVSRVELEGKALEIKPSTASTDVERQVPAIARVASVPVFSAKPLAVTLASGQTEAIPTPAIAVVPHRVSYAPENAQADAAAGTRFAAAAGVASRRIIAVPSLQRAATVKVDVVPYYAPTRDGKIAKEETLSFTRALNEAVQENPARLSELFGTTPFKIAWSFTAVEAGTTTAVPVVVGPPSATQVTAEIVAGRFPGSMARISFPSDGKLYEVSATARVTDSYGSTGETTFSVSSHAIATNSADALVELASNLLEAPQLVTASALPEDQAPAPTDDASRRARMVRAVAIRSAQDGWVDLKELRVLVKGARRAVGK